MARATLFGLGVLSSGGCRHIHPLPYLATPSHAILCYMGNCTACVVSTCVQDWNKTSSCNQTLRTCLLKHHGKACWTPLTSMRAGSTSTVFTWLLCRLLLQRSTASSFHHLYWHPFRQVPSPLPSPPYRPYLTHYYKLDILSVQCQQGVLSGFGRYTYLLSAQILNWFSMKCASLVQWLSSTRTGLHWS